MYSFEELKKQIISLDFSKVSEIENLNLQQLRQYVTILIERINNEISNELILVTNSKISSIEELFSIKGNVNLTSHKLPVLIPTFHLLKRIEIDLKNV